METLLEIARIVTDKAYSRKSIDAMISDDAEGVLSAFLRGLIDGAYTNDDDAASALYQSDRSDARYRTLKSRALDRLLQTLLLLEIRKPNHPDYVVYYHRCARNLIAVRTLMTFGSMSVGMRIAEKTLVIAKKYQFTEFTLNLLTLLRESYAKIVDKRRFLESNQEIAYYLHLLEAELGSEELLDTLQLESCQNKFTHEQLLVLSKELYSQHLEIVDQFDSFKIRLNHYRFTVIHNALRGNLEAVRICCDEARAYLSGNNHLSQRSRVGEFGLLKLQACVNNRQSHLILDEIEEILECFTVGGTNWFLTLEFGIQAFIQCGDYQRAYALWCTGQRSGALSRSNPRVQEMWYILEAYFNLFLTIHGLEHELVVGRIDDVNTFTATAPELSKDQAGYSVHVLITQISLLIVGGAFDTAIKRMEYLRLYMSQYLKTPKDSPIRWFVARFSELAKAKFDIGRLTHSNWRYEPLQRSDAPAPEGFHEIVPLDALFDTILAHLQRNHHNNTSLNTISAPRTSVNKEQM